MEVQFNLTLRSPWKYSHLSIMTIICQTQFYL